MAALTSGARSCSVQWPQPASMIAGHERGIVTAAQGGSHSCQLRSTLRYQAGTAESARANSATRASMSDP